MDKETIAQVTPLATVLLPVYNGERYLAEAIDSVLNQTFSNFELLLLDDGSTDGSRALMESYLKKDPRCRLYSWANRGLVATLNAGLELANGALIIRMDADDICARGRFWRQIEFLMEHPECVVVGSSVMWVDPEGMPLRVAGNLFSHEEIDAENMRGGQVLHHPAVVMREEAVRMVGRYREGFRHAEDLDLFLRLAEIGKLANLPDILLSYRQHLSSVGHQYSAQQRLSVRKAVEEAAARRGTGSKEIAGTWTRSSPLQSRGEVHRRWGWWALNSGNVATARKHALRALVSRPFNLKNWVLVACAWRGY